MKLWINSKDKGFHSIQDVAIANTYGNKFIIALNFQMLDGRMPYYQFGLGKRLCYEITFNDYYWVIISWASLPKPDEYEIITQPDQTRNVRKEYQSMVLHMKSSQEQTDSSEQDG